MKIIKINNPGKTERGSLINKIAKAILESRVLILPTGTIYGISCRYDSMEALERIYTIKKRDKTLPFIILISRISDLKIFTDDISPFAEKIIQSFWNIKDPGPLTLVFNKKEHLKNPIAGSLKTIAIRLAGLKFLRDLINICGPIVSTSATISGTVAAPRKVNEIPASIRNNADFIVDYQSDLPGVESTIISVTGDRPILIREGKIKFTDIVSKIK
jgi:L-threonylcarbamoyladenylate synthase